MAEQKKNLSSFIQEIKEIILSSRANAVRSVDFCRVQMYWQMGKRIFEEEQQGKERQIMEATSSKIWLKKFNRSSGVDFHIVN